MWQDWLNFLLGLWMVISGFLPGVVHNKSVSLWNDLIVGVLVLIFGAWVASKKWPEWINVILGIWLIIAAFIPSVVTAAANNIIVGILIAIFGIWAAFMKTSEG